MSDNVAIYCVCFPEHEPLRRQKYQQDIMCNASAISDEYRSSLAYQGFVFDDVGDNISDLNWTLGDLTATYWIWKNSTCDIVGTSQYRRFWDDSIETLDFKENTLYIQEPLVFRETLKKQYIRCHGPFGISVLDSLVKNKRIKLSNKMLKKSYAIKYLHSCNMFFAYKDIYDRFCEILFEMVFEILENYKDEIMELDSYNRRVPAFLAERLITAVVVNKEYFFSNINIEPVKWNFLG